MAVKKQKGIIDGSTKGNSQTEGTNNQQEPAGQLHPTPPATGSKVGTDSPIVKGVPRRSPGVYGVDDGIPIE